MYAYNTHVGGHVSEGFHGGQNAIPYRVTVVNIYIIILSTHTRLCDINTMDRVTRVLSILLLLLWLFRMRYSLANRLGVYHTVL